MKDSYGDGVRNAGDAWVAAWLYVGAVVGGGFATGREVLQFFSVYGTWGIAGAVLTGVVFAVTGGAVAAICDDQKPRGHDGYFALIAPARWAPVLAATTLAAYFIALTVTLSALALLFSQTVGVVPAAALILAAATVFAIVATGTGMVHNLARIAGPVLVIAVILLSFTVVAGEPSRRPASAAHLLVPWWLSAFLYFCYNHVLALTVLTTLHQTIERRRAVWGAAAGGVLLGLMLSAVTAAVATTLPQGAAAEFPLALAAGGLGSPWPQIYAMLLATAMLTTAVAALWGLRQKIRLPNHLAAVTAAAALMGSVGFVPLVWVLYPLMGAAGSIFAALLGVRLVRGKGFGPA